MKRKSVEEYLAYVEQEERLAYDRHEQEVLSRGPSLLTKLIKLFTRRSSNDNAN